MTNIREFEVIIIGGSYAGLSAAMALGRSLRNVLVIDSGSPCNRQTPHSHNFLTQDGEAPGVIAAIAKTQVLQYNSVKWIDALAISGEQYKNGFLITTQTGEGSTASKEEFTAKKLIITTGIKDRLPDIEGFAECWGISVIHCPYCHGYEVRKQPTAILANGERAFHLASLVNNLTDSVTLLTTGTANFHPEQLAKLNKHDIAIIETGVAKIEHGNGYLQQIIFTDGSRRSFKALYAAVPFTQSSDIPVSLGCELTEAGHLKTDGFQKTTVPGVFACGDNSAMMRSVANAVYAGNLAGATVNKELTDEQF